MTAIALQNEAGKKQAPMAFDGRLLAVVTEPETISVELNRRAQSMSDIYKTPVYTLRVYDVKTGSEHWEVSYRGYLTGLYLLARWPDIHIGDSFVEHHVSGAKLYQTTSCGYGGIPLACQNEKDRAITGYPCVMRMLCRKECAHFCGRDHGGHCLYQPGFTGRNPLAEDTPQRHVRCDMTNQRISLT